MLAAQGEEPRIGLLPPEQASSMDLTPEAAQYVKDYTAGCIDGGPSQVKEGIIAAAERYGTDDVSIVTIAYSLADRVRSYELIAHEFGLLSQA